MFAKLHRIVALRVWSLGVCPAMALACLILSSAGAADLHVSPDGDDANNGASWPTAKKTIQAAIDAATDGDSILVADGCYVVSEPLLVEKGVKIQSVNGHDNTLITRDTAYETRLLIMSHAQAEISGFCMSNGLGRAYSESLPNHSSYGGAARILNGTMRDCLITHNTCLPCVPGVTPAGTRYGYGGGLYVDAGLVENCRLVNNTAKGDGSSCGGSGGGAALVDGIIRNCVISNNATAGTGNGQAHAGGVLITGTGQLLDCEIIGNKAVGAGNQNYSYGGGVYMTGAGMIGNCLILRNKATFSTPAGGGARIDAGLMTHCRVISNNVHSSSQTAASYGGGVAIYGSAVLRNTLVYCNTATTGGQLHPNETYAGGIYVAGSARVEYCTVLRNTCSRLGIADGVYLGGGELLNSVVSHNFAESDDIPFTLDHENLYQAAGLVRYSVVPRSIMINGANNSAVDPCLMASESCEFRPAPGSPCINAATPIAGVETDYSGALRSATTPDIGAWEAAAPDTGALRASFTTSCEDAFDSAEVTFQAHAAGANTAGLTYAWDLDGDGEDDVTGADKAQVTWLFDAAGYHPVRLTVRNAAAETAVCLKSAAVRIHPSRLYVAQDGSEQAPYEKPEKATATLQAAVDFAEHGSVVLVGKGAFGIETAPVILRRNIKVRGAGAAVSILERQGTGQTRLFIMRHPDAELSDLTLTKGSLNLSGLPYGAAVWLVQGLIDRCIISDNLARGQPNSNGYGGGVYMQGGTIRNSLFVGNTAWSNNRDGRGGGIYMTAGTIENCTIGGNRATRTSASYTSLGGGVYRTGGTIINSIIYHNTVDDGQLYPDMYAAAGATYCCSPELVEENGNINSDPEFAAWQAGDWQLSRASPCVNAASLLAWANGAEDLLGEGRLRLGALDMGAYELQPLPGTMFKLR